MSAPRLATVSSLLYPLFLISSVLGGPLNPVLCAQTQEPAAAMLPSVTFSVLYNFDAKCAASTAATHCDPAVQDGTSGVKVGAMIQGPPGDDNFYGATPGGGTHNLGTIFRVTLTKGASGNSTGAQATVLYNFGDAGLTDGRNPGGGLTVGSDGNLYGTTYGGGQKGFGTIFRMARGAGNPEILYSFRNGVPDPPQKGQPPPPPLTPTQIDDLSAAYPVSPPVLGPDGNLYGVTPSSNPGAGVLYQLSGGTLKCLHRFKGEESAMYGFNPSTLTLGTDGSFYGTTWQGGLGPGTVFNFKPSGAAGVITTLYRLRANGLDGGISNGVIQGRDGNLYGTTYTGGPLYRGVVFRLTLAGQYTVLHAFGGNQANPVAGLVEVLENDPLPPGSSAPPTQSYYLYGASALNEILFRLREAGDGKDFSTIYTFTGVTGAGPNVTPVLSRGDSNLYGIAAGGGKFNAGVFYRLNYAGPSGGTPACPPVSTAAPAAAVGNLTALSGAIQVVAPDGSCRTLKQGDSISMGDTIQTGTSRAYITFKDGTSLTLSENSKLKIDEYVFDPSDSARNKASYGILEGAFAYLSGLIGKKDQENIDTEYGSLGFRGTELIARYSAASVEIDLISGAATLPSSDPTKAKTVNAPIKIVAAASGITTSPLTQAQYNAIKTQLSPGN